MAETTYRPRMVAMLYAWEENPAGLHLRVPESAIPGQFCFEESHATPAGLVVVWQFIPKAFANGALE